MESETWPPVIDVRCRPCMRAREWRRLARFRLGRDDADGPVLLLEAGLSQERGWPAVPEEFGSMGARWGAGPPHRAGEYPRDLLKGRAPYWAGGKVRLRCACGHAPRPVPWERIVAALQAAPPGVSVIDL